MRINTKDLALTTIYAALYAALVFAFAPISYGPLQFRVAGALRPGISKKWVLAVGYALGALIGNLFTPFPLYYELAFMPVMSLLAGLAGYVVAKPFKGNYFVSGAVTAAIISVSVSWMLSQPLVANAPMVVTLPYLFVAEQIVCFLGAVVFTLIGRRFRWWKT
ncbi:MAG: QueT transporter family protein [Candidatus Bathyarchaeota archaeon]|nr:QueT transporter family protein [Candidatus Bathyarchaeota archaeon]